MGPGTGVDLLLSPISPQGTLRGWRIEWRGEHWSNIEGLDPNRPQVQYLIGSVSDGFGVRKVLKPIHVESDRFGIR
jgi:hypothetical protein